MQKLVKLYLAKLDGVERKIIDVNADIVNFR